MTCLVLSDLFRYGGARLPLDGSRVWVLSDPYDRTCMCVWSVGRENEFDRLIYRERGINVWRGVVDFDTAESAVGVTEVRLRGKGCWSGVSCLMGGESVYSANGLQDACLFGGERCFGNIATIMCGVR